MVIQKMKLIVGPLYDKIRWNNNTNNSSSIVRVVEKTASSLEAETRHPSVLEFCGSLKIGILPLFNWNKFAYVYPVPSFVTRQYRSLKENFEHGKDCHILDDSTKISPKKIVEGPDSSYHPVENILINILIVDDDRDILFTFKSILEAEGYNVQAFADPKEALSHFSQMDPSYYDLVLTDIRMPNFNGFQFYQKLREINTGVRVIFMSAFDVPGNLLDTMPAIKDSDIIRKPIEEEHFVKRIKKAINLE
jgi:CheY-like chemotaxis protein